jgi:hypothetical protein
VTAASRPALHDSSEHHQARLAPRLCSPRSFRSRRQSHTPAPSKIVVAVPCTPCAAARACHAVRRATSPRLGSLKPRARRAAADLTPTHKPPPSGWLFLGSKPDAVCPPLTLCLEVATRLVRGLVCAHCTLRRWGSVVQAQAGQGSDELGYKLAFGCVVHFCSPLGPGGASCAEHAHAQRNCANCEVDFDVGTFQAETPSPVTPSPFRRDGVQQQLASHACGAKRVPVSRRSSHRTLLTLVGG